VSDVKPETVRESIGSGALEMDARSFEDWNERMAEEWDFDAYYNTPNVIIRYLEQKRTFWILEFLRTKNNDKILEIGCGAGHIIEKLDGGILYGIDLSKRLLSIARDRLGSRAELKRCNAEAIAYPDHYFDKVLCADIIEHVQNPRKALEEIKRVTTKDGIVVISVPNDKLICRFKQILIELKLFRLLFKKVGDTRWDWHLHAFDLSTLRKLTKGFLEEIDMKVIPNKLLPLRYIGKYRIL